MLGRMGPELRGQSLVISGGLLMSQCEQSGACEVLQRMRSGRLRGFRTLEKFFQQYRLYRRAEHGQRVKQGDLLRGQVRRRTVLGRIAAARLLVPGGRIRVAARKESGSLGR